VSKHFHIDLARCGTFTLGNWVSIANPMELHTIISGNLNK
jgi:hypothetical protein